MKQGTTPTIEFKLDIEISNVTEVIFTFTDELAYKGTSDDETTSYLLQKNYPDDATFEDDVFKLPLTQEETDLLTNTFYVEAQVICDKAVVKSDVKKINMPHTLWTTYVDDNESDGNSEVIHLSFSDYVRVEGGSGTDNYNDLDNKPQINNVTLQGNKTSEQLGLENPISAGDGLKREDNTMSVDIDSNSVLEFNNHKLSADTSGLQPTISGGNGIDVSSDVVSVNLGSGIDPILQFTNTGALTVNETNLGRNLAIRQALVGIPNNSALASKSYVDNLMSGAVKRLVVQTLPTQDIDTNTIYMVLKSVPSTNNIYDEYMYINNEWELIGTTEVDLSNYYNKSQTDNLLLGKVDKVETSGSVELTPFTLTSAINVENYSQFLGTDLSGDVLEDKNSVVIYLYDENNTEISRTPIADSSYNFIPIDISNATTIKLEKATTRTSTLTYKLSNEVVRERELTTKLADKQDTLTAGTNITIDANNVISASGGGLSYTFTDGLTESSGTVGIDLASGSKLLIDANDKLDVDLSSKQNTIDSTHKLDADNVDDSESTNKFVLAAEKAAIGKEPKYELIKTIDISELSEPVSMITIDEDENGDSFAVDDVIFNTSGLKASVDNSKISFKWASGTKNNAFERGSAILSSAGRRFRTVVNRENEDLFNVTMGGSMTMYDVILVPNLTISEKIDSVSVYTDSTFTEGILKIYGKVKY